MWCGGFIYIGCLLVSIDCVQDNTCHESWFAFSWIQLLGPGFVSLVALSTQLLSLRYMQVNDRELLWPAPCCGTPRFSSSTNIAVRPHTLATLLARCGRVDEHFNSLLPGSLAGATESTAFKIGGPRVASDALTAHRLPIFASTLSQTVARGIL